MNASVIEAGFDYTSQYIQVHQQSMHYIEEGSGDPILFLHGNPTSCYLWRNIIPYLSKQGRCIAPDLIGMGKSAKPDLDYRFVDHAKYIKGFIDALELKNITLVLHDWGSGLGFHYAMSEQHNVKAIAFMESFVKPKQWKEFPGDFKLAFKLMRTPVVGWFMVSVMNGFLNSILPKATLRSLTQDEKVRYKAPFPTIASRKPVRQWPLEIPIDGQPADVHQIMSEYSEKLQNSLIPKLLLHVKPGGLIDAETLQWCEDHLPNLKTVDVGESIHYMQEDNPHAIGRALADWYPSLDR